MKSGIAVEPDNKQDKAMKLRIKVTAKMPHILYKKSFAEQKVPAD